MLEETHNKIISSLPGCTDNLFKALWLQGKLRFDLNGLQTDEIDLHNARLVCAAITEKKKLLISLPDFAIHRPALLFATMLLRVWKNYPPTFPAERRRILYFGTEIGIRQQLKQVKIRDSSLRLSDVFQQTNINRNSTSTNIEITQELNNLPYVVTIYVPYDPALAIRQHLPQCIAVDLSDAPNVDWLQSLLKEASGHKIPVVAWGQNPLSETVSLFRQFGEVIVWSPKSIINNELSEFTTEFQPFLLESPEANYISEIFQKIAQILFQEAKCQYGQLGNDALRIHWQLLQTLETLFVPFNFYEAETGSLWGLKNVSKLRETSKRFSGACQRIYPKLAQGLDQIGRYFDDAIKELQQNDPPLWSAACNFCLSEPSETIRAVVFNGKNRKQLFLFAILAYYNFTEKDLRDVGIYIVTLDELRRSIKQNYLAETDQNFSLPLNMNCKPLLVGLPSRWVIPRLLPLLWHKTIEVMIYPHQITPLRHRVEEIDRATMFDATTLHKTLETLSGKRITSPKYRRATRLIWRRPEILNVQSAKRETRTESSSKLWQIGTQIEEIERVLQPRRDPENESNVFRETQTEPAENEELWCQEVVRVEFSSGSSVVLPSDEMINVVRRIGTNLELEERFVKALKVGDRIVFIHNQRRQNFYDLLISRLHQLPEMTLHLNLIGQWQNELVITYKSWCRDGKNDLETLLTKLQANGSRISTTLALRWWLQGKVLAPLDREDLRRLAEILGMEFVKGNYIPIDHAAARLRGLHRGLAIRLNRWLTAQAASIETYSDDDLIDPNLNLSFGDLRSSLMLLTVTNTQMLSGLWLRSELGGLEN